MPAAVLDALPAHLCVLDAQGAVLWVNRAWREFAHENGGRPELTCEGSNYLTACRPAELKAGPAGEPLPEHELLCSFTAALRDVLEGRRARAEAEYPCHSPTEQRWFVVEATALSGPGAARAVVAHHPITLRRLADMRQREELRLQALGTLASGIAHDFNNLLSVIVGRSRMALEDLGAGHPVAAHIEPARAAAERAIGLVAKILAFSRGEPGPAQEQDLVAIVRDAVDLFRASLPPGVNLVCEFGPSPMLVRVDATEIGQVVLNLCGNAVDALRGGQRNIGVRLSRVAAMPSRSARSTASAWPRHAHGVAEIVVEDDGVGIPESLRERIFEPFFSTKPPGQGTGLGLAIVHGIVNRHGGTIEVQSRPQQGSRFGVYLPLASAAAHMPPVAEPGAARAEPRAPRPALRVAPRVLLVDDDEVVGLAIEAFLARSGFVIRRVHEAAAALRLLQDGAPYELVLTDSTMPGITGLELATALRDRHPALPVVLMSGYIDDRLHASALAAGVHAVLPKERIYDELLPALREVLAMAKH